MIVANTLRSAAVLLWRDVIKCCLTVLVRRKFGRTCDLNAGDTKNR